MMLYVVRIIFSQKIYGFYGLKHHIVEIRGDVTGAGRTLKIEPLSKWKLKAEFCRKRQQVEVIEPSSSLNVVFIFIFSIVITIIIQTCKK